MEIGGKDSDHRAWKVVDDDFSSNDGWIAVKLEAPELMAQDDASATAVVVTGVKGSSQRGVKVKHIEKFGSDLRRKYGNCSLGGNHAGAAPGESGHVFHELAGLPCGGQIQ